MTRIAREVYERLVGEAKEAIEEMKDITSMSRDDFIKSRRARFSLRYSIVMAVEALADLAIAILEKDFNEVVESYREAFMKLLEKGIISAEIAESMVKLVSLRNLIVHRYWVINDLRIYEEAKRGGIKVLEEFISEVSRYVEAEDP
ncbi:MAG: DUF86 domain-containing protein [Candidatus Korarchaeota archaeon NZ13-K]|nr:MAG: DUF86 domain-containing protein [Candidatus Korarchaeota archaeon NZ13-K]